MLKISHHGSQHLQCCLIFFLSSGNIGSSFSQYLLWWQLSKEFSCFLRKREHCTLAHILGACKISLQQDRFTYQHNSILLKLIDTQKANCVPNEISQTKKILFVKSGTPPLKRTTNKSGILFLANEWKVVADVNKQYTFLIQIALIPLCLNILIYSLSLRHAIIMKLTSPCEQNKERWHSLKCNKYEQLVYTIKKNKKQLLVSGSRCSGSRSSRILLQKCIKFSEVTRISRTNWLDQHQKFLVTHLRHVFFIFGWHEIPDLQKYNIGLSQLSHYKLTKHILKTHKDSLDHLKI